MKSLRRVAIVAGGILALACAGARGDDVGQKVPPFPTKDPKSWIGTPVTWKELRGQVVLLDVWAFKCENCVNTVPWIKDVRARYGPRGLALVGVHTPELSEEREAESVRREVAKHGLDYPHLLDTYSTYWEALHTQAWPTLYLVDRCNRIRDVHVGEVIAKDAGAVALEAKIEALLNEKSCQS